MGTTRPPTQGTTRSCAATPRSPGNTNTGRFLAPKTAVGIRARNWFLGSRAFSLMTKFGDQAANDIDLADYPAQAGARA